VEGNPPFEDASLYQWKTVVEIAADGDQLLMEISS
jgi:hypothetical protein